MRLSYVLKMFLGYSGFWGFFRLSAEGCDFLLSPGAKRLYQIYLFDSLHIMCWGLLLFFLHKSMSQIIRPSPRAKWLDQRSLSFKSVSQMIISDVYFWLIYCVKGYFFFFLCLTPRAKLLDQRRLFYKSVSQIIIRYLYSCPWAN